MAWPTTLTVTVRTDFTTTEDDSYWHASTGDYHAHWDGRAVGNATVEIVDSGISDTTNAHGVVELDTSPLPDGLHILRITAENVSADPVGPAIADPVSDPLPERIYRVLDIWIETLCGGLVEARVIPARLSDGSLTETHGKIGNTVRRVWDPDDSPNSLPVDLKPIWMHSRRHGAAIHPSLIVIHHTGGRVIGNALNTLPSPPSGNSASAHYIIDRDGHIVKLNRDTVNGQHAGFSFWGARTVNGFSIGIEIVNAGAAYPLAQYQALEGLLERLLAGYAIAPHRIVGHSDISTNVAPTMPAAHLGNKAGDPGVSFEWNRLERRGWGLVPMMGPIPGVAYGGLFTNADILTDAEKLAGTGIVLQPEDNDNSSRFGGHRRAGFSQRPITELQQDLLDIGYFVSTTGRYDQRTESAVQMFREHFWSRVPQINPATVDGATANLVKQVRHSMP
jgi:N-acetylmuramoyl-L-alanine amidase